MGGGLLSYLADWNGSGQIDLPAEWLTVLGLCALAVLAFSVMARGLAQTLALVQAHKQSTD